MTNKETLFGISEAARRLGVAEGTIRSYDRRGTVSPVRDSTGRRLFTEADIKQVQQYRAERNQPIK